MLWCLVASFLLLGIFGVIVLISGPRDDGHPDWVKEPWER
jgi:hypothetical protein